MIILSVFFNVISGSKFTKDAYFGGGWLLQPIIYGTTFVLLPSFLVCDLKCSGTCTTRGDLVVAYSQAMGFLAIVLQALTGFRFKTVRTICVFVENDISVKKISLE